MLDKITPGVSNPNNKSHFYKFSRKPIILRAVIDEGYCASNRYKIENENQVP